MLRVREAADAGDVRYLIESLSDIECRDLAAIHLGRLRAAEAVPHLLRSLNAHSDGHRVTAIKALKAIGDRSAVPRLLEVAEEDVAFGVRITAVDAAATLGNETAISMLVQLATHPLGRASGTVRNFDTWVPTMKRVSRASLRRTRRWARKRLTELGLDAALDRPRDG